MKRLISALHEIKINDIVYIDRKIYNRIKKIAGILEYKYPMLITEYTLYSNPYYYNDTRFHAEYNSYPLCPRCNLPTEHDYQRYCEGCGQRLKWAYSKMTLRSNTG